MTPGSVKIAVFAGGPSCEREVSLISGKAVADALGAMGFSVVNIDPVGDFMDRLKAEKVDIVFLALHGTFGEDGTVQRMLDEAGILYTGSAAEPSRAAFDKSEAQRIFRSKGLPVSEFRIFDKNAAWEKGPFLPFPFVVKPASSGSSVGVSFVFSGADLHSAFEEAFKYSDRVLMETYVDGRELTVGILGDQALPVVEVIPQRKFYDYEAKYKDTGTRYEVPAVLSAPVTSELQRLAMAAHQALGCEVMSRVDILLDREGHPYILEINTIPGLTGKSLLPKAARAAGIEFGPLCVRILELSRSKATARKGVVRDACKTTV